MAAEYKGLEIKFTGDSSELQRALEEVQKKAVTTQEALEYIGGGARFGYGLMQAGSVFKSVGDSISRFGAKLSIASLAVLLTKGRQLVQVTEEFGNKVAQVGGYLQISGERLEAMRELALQFGKDTIFSATEAAEAISELAKGGLTDAQIAAGALDATLQLAAAGQMDFASAAKTTAQALKAFQLDAEDVVTVADALAGAASNSVATVEGLSSGFAYAASWARNAGWSVNEVSGALALLSDYGIDAEMAGTALRNVLLRLAAPTDKARGIMEDLGIEVRDSNGHMKSAVEVIDELNFALSGLADDERDSIISAIFGVRGANAALALMDAGSQELQKYIGYTQDMGAASRMAQAQLGELGWALELMRGEAETAAVNFGEVLTPTLVQLANTAEDICSWFNALSDEERKQVVNMALMAIGTGPLLVVAGKAISILGSITSGLGAVILGGSAFVREVSHFRGAAQGLSAAFGAVKFVEAGEAASMAAASIKALEVGLTGVAVVAGAIVAGAIFMKLTEKWRKAREEARLFAERTERLAQSNGVLLNSVRDTYPELDREADAYSRIADAADTSAEHIDRLADEHRQLAETMESRNKSAQETIDTLSTAKRYVDDYAGAEHLAAEEVAKLQWALDVINQTTGSNYELLYAYSGVIGENGEAVDNLRESLDKLIDARVREAQAAALSANMTDAYKEQYTLERERVALVEDIARNKAEAEQLIADMRSGAIDWNEGQRQLDELNSEYANLQLSLSDVDAKLEDTNATIEFCTQKLGELQGSIENTTDLLNTVMHVAGQDTFGRLGERSEEFADRLLSVNARLSELGQDTIDFSRLSQEQWDALVTALWADGYSLEDMLALVTGNLGLASADWRSTIEQWAADNGISADIAMQAIVDGIDDGSVDVSNGLEGVLSSSLGRAKEYASEHAPEVGDAADRGVASGMNRSTSYVSGAAENVAGSVSRVLDSLDSYQWGIDAIKNFADGMFSNSAQSAVLGATSGIARIVADNLKHSKPKEGVLRDDDIWGTHFVENFASGINKGLPSLERSIGNMTSTLGWGVSDQSLYMSAGSGYGSATAIYVDGNAIVTDARLQAASENFMRELARKADM